MSVGGNDDDRCVHDVRVTPHSNNVQSGVQLETLRHGIVADVPKNVVVEAPDPRTVRSRSAVLDATVELMVERGVHAVSVDAIVERSGVAKTTVYRHWPTREALIKAAWTSVIPPETIAATGTVHEQASDIALAFSQRIGTRPMSVLLPDLMAEAGRDESLRQMYEDVLRSRRR